MTQRVGNIWPLCDGRKGLSVQVAEGVKGWRFDGVFGVAKHVGGRHRLLQEQFFRTVSCRWWYGSARYGRLPAKKTARVLRVCNGYWGWAATRQPGRCSINKALIAVAAEAAPGRGKTIGRIRLRHIPACAGMTKKRKTKKTWARRPRYLTSTLGHPISRAGCIFAAGRRPSPTVFGVHRGHWAA